jgi:hypothetical protein
MPGSVAQKGQKLPHAGKATNRHTVGVAEGECREQREPSTILLLASTPSKQSRCAERRLLPRARCRCTRGQQRLPCAADHCARPASAVEVTRLRDVDHSSDATAVVMLRACPVADTAPPHVATEPARRPTQRRSYEESRSQFHLIRGNSLASQKFTGTGTSPKSTGTSFYAPVRSI